MADSSSTFQYQGPGDDGVFTDPISEVRFLVKDTVEGGVASLSDQELAYYLIQAGSVRGAAALAADARAGLFAATPKRTLTVGPFATTTDYAGNAADMRSLAEALRSGAAASSPVVGLADPWAAYEQPVFDLHMQDYRGPGRPDRLYG